MRINCYYAELAVYENASFHKRCSSKSFDIRINLIWISYFDADLMPCRLRLIFNQIPEFHTDELDRIDFRQRINFQFFRQKLFSQNFYKNLFFKNDRGFSYRVYRSIFHFICMILRILEFIYDFQFYLTCRDFCK